MIIDMSTAYLVELVSLRGLKIDRSYQRHQNDDEIDQIVANFDFAAYTPFLLGRRTNGTLYIIDGQERWQAGLLLGIESHWACIIDGTTPMMEAEIFLRVNRDRKGISALDKFKASLKAREESTVAIQKIVASAGFDIPIGRTPSKSWPEIACVGALRKVWNAGVLPRVLSTISRNWSGVNQALSDTLVNGLGEFFKRFGDDLDTARFDNVLSQIAPEELLLQASIQYRMTGGGRYIGVAKELVAQYNVAKKIQGVRKLAESKQLVWE